MTDIKLIISAAAFCLTATAVSAMPVAPVAANTVARAEQVHWVCGPYRCWWRLRWWLLRPRILPSAPLLGPPLLSSLLVIDLGRSEQPRPSLQ